MTVKAIIKNNEAFRALTKDDLLQPFISENDLDSLMMVIILVIMYTFST